tara:strand:- start:582 stop:752 length:171 start_codon:yes stop_codon:yes gene_type:complete
MAYCDDCGEVLTHHSQYPISHLKHNIATENEGGSAVLCSNCLPESWDADQMIFDIK